MKLFQGLLLLGILSTAVTAQVAFAEETWSEEAGAKGNDVKRELKKAGHKIQEETCTAGDATCAGRKVKNRAVEAKDATVDGVKKVKNKID